MLRTLVMVLALAVTGALPGPDVPERFDTPEAEARAAAGRADISAELAGERDDAWAGSYYWGDGLGANVSLDLSPAAGFVFEWHGCLGLYGRNFGPVSESEGRLLLEPELPNKTGESQGIDVEFVPVTWGPRHYLITAGKIEDFCNAVNGGSEPRKGMHGMFLLRRGDEAKPATGRPRTREGELHCLLDHPVEARIVSVGPRRTIKGQEDSRWAEVTIVLDAGREQGVWTGMELRLVAPARSYLRARVTRVDERSSEAVVTTLDEEGFELRPGWVLSTRPD